MWETGLHIDSKGIDHYASGAVIAAMDTQVYNLLKPVCLGTIDKGI